MFKRKIEAVIENYVTSKQESVLVIDGARQVGKSFIIRYVCSKYFENYIEVNLRDDFDGDRLFENVKSTHLFYLQLSALYGNRLGNNENTIIFLDEIQVYPHLVSMLKPLRYDNRFRYIASGSLLGVTLKKTFIPMGSIDEYSMYPMDFEEFLWANGVGEESINYLRDCFANIKPVNDSIHRIFLNYFKEFLISGGLPDSVKAFVEQKNIQKVRDIQTSIFRYYKDDATQYDMACKLLVSRIYDMMPSYMENKVKRLEICHVEEKKGVQLDRYRNEFDYLISSGTAIGVTAISEPKFPLNLSESKNLVKLYYNDVGLLTNCLFKNNICAILNKDNGINLGSVYETVVACELKAHGHDLYYFDKRKTGEVDFLINDYDTLSALPIEVKSGNDQANYRAIPKLVESGCYNIQKGYILGNKNITERNGKLITYPVYMMMFI